jgi:protein-tyrosine phosphatase
LLDLHCHILPGVDDGAVDLPDAIAMARAAVAGGIRAVCASSHLGVRLFGTTPELLASERAVLVQALAEEEVPLTVLPGAENFLAGSDPVRFAEEALPLGESDRYILMDFSMSEVPSVLPAALAALAARGRTAVIAHPERNRALQRDPSPLAAWVAQGALLQVNASSLAGYLGPEAREAGLQLLRAGAAHVLSSDAHGRDRRPFCLAEGWAVAAGEVGEEEADRLVRERPWKIARGEPIATEPPRLPSRTGGGGLLRRLWGRDK